VEFRWRQVRRGDNAPRTAKKQFEIPGEREFWSTRVEKGKRERDKARRQRGEREASREWVNPFQQNTVIQKEGDQEKGGVKGGIFGTGVHLNEPENNLNPREEENKLDERQKYKLFRNQEHVSSACSGGGLMGRNGISTGIKNSSGVNGRRTGTSITAMQQEKKEQMGRIKENV